MRVDQGGVTGRGVEFDLTCGVCGYNLRGVPVRNRCPECGASMGAAINAASIRETRLPRFLRRIAAGDPRSLALVTLPLGGIMVCSAMLLGGVGPLDPAVYVPVACASLPAVGLAGPFRSRRDSMPQVAWRIAAAFGTQLVAGGAVAIVLLLPPEAAGGRRRLYWLFVAVPGWIGYVWACRWTRDYFKRSSTISGPGS